MTSIIRYPWIYTVGQAVGRLAEPDRTVPHFAQDSQTLAVECHCLTTGILSGSLEMDVERRKHPRISILVDLEMAVGNHGVARGVALNLSREGISLRLEEGDPPELDKVVIITFKIWTGRERLSRSLNARVLRMEDGQVSLKFEDHDPISEAAIQDLLFYLQFDRRRVDGSSAA